MSAWIQYVKKTQASQPGMSYKDAMIEAKKTYKRADGKPVVRKVKKSKVVKPKVIKPEEVKQEGKGPEHARFSSEIYKKPKERQSVQNYEYKEGDSDQGYWESPEKIVIVFRGTTNTADVKTDAVLAVGLLKKTKRYKKSLAFAKKIMRKAKDKNVEIAGHSLGGSIAAQVGLDLNLKSFVYNPGASVKENVKSKIDKIACAIKPKGKRCKKAKSVTVERTLGDPVSVLGKHHPNTKTIIPSKINVHGISNFKQLED